MKRHNNKTITIFFLVVTFFVFNPINSNAQTKLVDSVWQGVANYKLKSVDLKLTIIVQFLGNNKVDGYTLIQTYGSKATEKYNIYSGRYETNLEYALLSTSEKREFGTYKLNGNTVFIKLSEVTINATFKDNYLDGEATLSFSNDKSKWIAEKVADGKAQTKVNSQNQPKLLGLYDRLPENLGQFKRTRLQKYTYIKDYKPPSSGNSAANIQEAIRKAQEFEQKRPIENGETDGGFATYLIEQNKLIVITFTKYKDIASATEGFRKEVSETNPKGIQEFVVKNEAKKNKNGEIVGRLMVFRNTSEDGKQQREIIIFSFNEFVYYLFANKFGDGEKLSNLLPLE